MREIIWCLGLLLFCISCAHEEPVTPAPVGCTAKYASDIVAIVNSKCALSGCHEGGSRFGDFTAYAALKERVDNGRVEKNVYELKIMPPSTQAQLTDEEKDKLKCWLDDGAPQN